MEKFLISKNSTQICNFGCDKSILVRLWVKVFLSQGLVKAKITVETL